MDEQALQTTAIQKALGLSERDALKGLLFVTEINAGKGLQSNEKAAKRKEPKKIL